MYGLVLQRYYLVISSHSQTYITIQVFQHVYCKRTSRNQLHEVMDACTEFVDSVKSHDAALLNKPKFHLFLHLPTCIEEFGRIGCYNSERCVALICLCITLPFNIRRCESFNGLMRLHNLHSNRHASSHDIAVGFAHVENIRHLLHGGSPRFALYRFIIVLYVNKMLICSCKVGAGLLVLASKKEVQKRVFFNESKSKSIYKQGALRKVRYKLPIKPRVMFSS